MLVTSETFRRRWERRLDYAIFTLFLLFALTLPHSVKGAHHALQGILLLWFIKLAVERRRPLPQPLVLPMLVFFALSGLSTALSPTPILSWDRMKIVDLILVAVLVGQNVRTLRQMKWIVGLLLFSAVVSTGLTGWQYLGGYGVALLNVPENSPLALAGIQSGDVVQSVNGHGIHSPKALQETVARMSLQSTLHVHVVQGTPIQHLNVTLSRASFLGSGLLFPNAPLARGRPVRPQGYFTHYAIYAEVMLQFGLLAWGLLLARRYRKSVADTALSQPRLARQGGNFRRSGTVLLALVFVLMLITVAATQTRSALGAMLLGTFAVLMLAATWKERAIGIGLLIIVIALGTAWIHHTRGLGWVDKRDPGTSYRVLMWEDALRLIPQHPLVGVGMESVHQYWQKWDIRAWRIYGVQWHFHSDYLQIAVERGLPALAAWLWLVVAYLLFLWKLLPRARAAGWFAHGITLSALGGFLAFLAAGVVQYNLGEEQISVVLWFVVGLTLALHHILPAAAPTQLPKTFPALS